MTDAERIKALEGALQEAIDVLGAVSVEVALGKIEVVGGSRVWLTDALAAKWEMILHKHGFHIHKGGLTC